LVQRGFSYCGIEPSRSLYDRAINDFSELEGKVQNCFLDQADLSAEKFDLVVMVDTFEHIPFPVQFLENLRFLVRSRAFLYLEVPNEACLTLKGRLRRFLGLYDGFPTHPTHVNLFTADTLPRLLEKTSLTLKKMYPVTILGDFERMKFVLGEGSDLYARLISGFFGMTKLDLLVGQGNLAAMSVFPD